MKKIIHFFVGILLSSLGFTQSMSKQYHLKHNIRQENQQYEFTVMDFKANGVYAYDKSKFYYWLKAQTVHATQGYSSGLLLHGEFQGFYDNKQLSKRGYFYKGLKNGEWLYWNENGVLIHIEHWKSGIKSGVEKKFDAQGDLLYKVKHGKFKTTRQTKDSLLVQYDRQDKIQLTLFDHKGEKIQVIRKKGDHLHGKQESYTDGKISQVEYYNDGEKTEQKSTIPILKKGSDKDKNTQKSVPKKTESKKIEPKKNKKKLSIFSKKDKTST